MLRRTKSSIGSTTTTAPAENMAAFNALMFRYANTSALQTTHDISTSGTTWWNERKIDATMTRAFVASTMRAQDRPQLDLPVAFGAGLTDDTYVDWILQRSRRLFLILLDLGLQRHIFELVDDSWDDEDLPMTMDAVERLRLPVDRDANVAERFYARQFHFLLRELRRGDHRTYSSEEIVPLDTPASRSGVSFVTTIDKVSLPDRPAQVFTRKRISFKNSPSLDPEKDFRAAIEGMRGVDHQHVISVFASYVHGEAGYLLVSPTTELSLRSFINLPPQHFRRYPRRKQGELLINWLHCLSDAVAFLHSHGLAHQNIRPSSILVDSSDKIILGDSGDFDQLLGSKRPNPLECYEYGAPEGWTGATSRAGSVDGGVSRPRPDSSFILAAKPVFRLSQGSDHVAMAKRSDIFSLACVYLDILSFLLKRKLTTFASHRSSKNKSGIRAIGPADTSFHANAFQVSSWIDGLEKRSMKKDDISLKTVSPILRLCRHMLSRNPSERPTARYVEEMLHDILMGPQGFATMHCRMYAGSQSSFEGFNLETASFATKQSSTDSSSSRSMETVRLKPHIWQEQVTSVFEYD